MTPDPFVLVALRGTSIRSWTMVHDLDCAELSEILSEWHRTDFCRQPAVMRLSEVTAAIKKEAEPDQ